MVELVLQVFNLRGEVRNLALKCLDVCNMAILNHYEVFLQGLEAIFKVLSAK